MSCTEKEINLVAELIGRTPRGLEAIVVKDHASIPVVIRVAPLVEKKPFPTLFWLVDKRLNYAIDQLEASGLIAVFQQRVDSNDALQSRLEEDHQQHIALRASYFSDQEKQVIDDLGFMDVFSSRGIGGIADFQRIRCLHTYYAAHLVNSNAVGRMLDDYWQQNGIVFEHIA